MTEFILMASLLILLCSAVLWGAQSYDDGIVGRVGLGFMSGGSIIVLAGHFFGEVKYTFLPEIGLTYGGAALFLCYHVRKHLRFWTKERRSQPTAQTQGVEQKLAGARR